MTDELRRELSITEEEVWEEHLRQVNAGAHAVYLLAVLVVGFLLMVALIAALGGTAAG
jgi:hypothetical protein